MPRSGDIASAALFCLAAGWAKAAETLAWSLFVRRLRAIVRRDWESIVAGLIVGAAVSLAWVAASVSSRSSGIVCAAYLSSQLYLAGCVVAVATNAVLFRSETVRALSSFGLSAGGYVGVLCGQTLAYSVTSARNMDLPWDAWCTVYARAPLVYTLALAFLVGFIGASVSKVPDAPPKAPRTQTYYD